MSGKYGSHGNIYSTFFGVSNDQGYQEVVARIHESVAQNPQDIGAFIGSGGLFSWLPDLNLRAAVMIDLKGPLLDFNKYVLELIKASSSPEEVLQKLTNADEWTLEDAKIITPASTHLPERLFQEQAVYGADHWSNPNRFLILKETLETVPVAFLEGNIARTDFTQEFAKAVDMTNHKITFANLTNVADYTTTTGFLRQWPFADQPTILYSQNSTDARLPQMAVAESVDNYRQAVKK